MPFLFMDVFWKIKGSNVSQHDKNINNNALF